MPDGQILFSMCSAESSGHICNPVAPPQWKVGFWFTLPIRGAYSTNINLWVSWQDSLYTNRAPHPKANIYSRLDQHQKLLCCFPGCERSLDTTSQYRRLQQMCPKAAEMSAITGIISMWSHFLKINLQILSAVILSKAGTLKQYPTFYSYNRNEKDSLPRLSFTSFTSVPSYFWLGQK